MGRLSLRLLGAPEVRHADAPVSFATRKALALLAYLAVQSGTHTREKLTALFWPESDPERGRAALRYTLAALRSALGESREPGHLQIGRDAVRFEVASNVDVDLLAFEEESRVAQSLARETQGSTGARQRAVGILTNAAQRWRGEFLEGFSLPDAPAFDEWASVQREREHRQAELVFEQLAQAQSEAGARAEATETGARWVAMSPLNEAAHRQLMQLYLAAGEPAAALRAYAACQAVLKRELGTRPDPQTEALAERVRAARPASRQPVRDDRATGMLDWPLVGRSDEFVRLVELYHAALRGRSHLAVVRGEAGIGKTRLTTEFLGWAESGGADVLRGRAFEAGGRLPYQPLVDALRPRVERENAPADLLADVWLAELSRLLPELRERYPDLPPLAADETTARTRLYEAAVRLVQVLAERNPIVLFVDDVQWADAASLDVLQYAAHRWEESHTPVFVLLTLRSETLAERRPLGEWLAGLRRGGSVVETELGPLTLADTRDLLEQSLGAGCEPKQRPDDADAGLASFASWLFSETSGQPFFLVEMLRTLVDRGLLARPSDLTGGWALDRRLVTGEVTELRGFVPPGVREVVSARVGRLSVDARALLAAGAVLGQAFTFEQLCHVADVTEMAALAALDEAVRAHLLRESQVEGTPGAYGFTHDKIRDVVHAEAGQARRRIYHRRAFEQLLDRGAAAELAGHALAAGLDEPAFRFSIQAGDDAMRLLAARDAVGHYERALQTAERKRWPTRITEARGRRGRAFASVALWAEAKQDLEAVLLTVDPGETERRAELHEDLAEACFWLMDTPSVYHHAAEALELAEQIGRQDLVMAARGWRGAAHGADGKVSAAVDEYEQAVERARQFGLAPPAHVLSFHSLTLYWQGRLGEAVDRSRSGVEAARTANDASVMMYSLPHLGLSLAACGRYVEALEVFAEARRFGREYRVHNLLARAIAMSSGFRLELGDFATAEELSNEARDLALSANWPPTAASASIDLLFNFVWRGDIGRAEQLLNEVAGAVEKATGFHGWLWRLRLAQARAEIATAREAWEEAVRLGGVVISQSRARGRRKYEAAALHTRARALAALGRRSEAVVDLQGALRHARGMGDPALFLRVAPALMALAGDQALAEEARALTTRVRQSLPDAELQRSFDASPLVGALADSWRAG